ncbi:MAG: glycosyltransferase [Clostridia bacterium]|nr:glycosyltransferase [Clostridia bacterium]
MMLISVIMPCYNSARYLSECLNTVLAQSVRDFELIIIDDGSCDQTLGIAKRYAEMDPRITVLHQENAGVSAARNLGLERASGEWVTFVDSDDLLPPDAFEVMLGAADDDADMVVCAHETFDESGKRQVFIPETGWARKTGEKKRHAAALRLIEGDSVLNIMCNKLHRRALIEREHLRLQPDVRIAEDALFNLEAVLCARDIVYVNRITYRYRTHSASAMHTQAKGELCRHEPWLAAMKEMLLRRGIMERYYAAYLDSVVLRLYKDGGVQEVVRSFADKAIALLPDGQLCVSRLTLGSRFLHAVVRCGCYPYVYPLIWMIQTVKRKSSEAAFALRASKEMPE